MNQSASLIAQHILAHLKHVETSIRQVSAEAAALLQQAHQALH